MASYFFSNKAVDDLSMIWNYTVETWSESQADKYYHLLLECCQEIAEGKVSGKQYTEVGAEILGCRSGQHVIFYRKMDNGNIEIVRILHGRMDLKIRLQ